MTVYVLSKILLSSRYPRSFDDEHVTITLLHMSSKYQAHGLRAQILEYLRPYFPTTLDSWWAKKRRFGERTPFSKKGTIIALANAAEYAAPHLLPAAFLLLNRYYESLEQPWHTGKLNGKRVVLHPSLTNAFLRGRERLGALAMEVVYPRIFRCPSDASEDFRRAWSACERGRDGAIRSLRLAGPGCIVNPFKFSVDKPAWYPDWFCSLCLANLELDYRVGTRVVWGQLPEVFELPVWDVLLKQAKD